MSSKLTDTLNPKECSNESSRLIKTSTCDRSHIHMTVCLNDLIEFTFSNYILIRKQEVKLAFLHQIAVTNAKRSTDVEVLLHYNFFSEGVYSTFFQ